MGLVTGRRSHAFRMRILDALGAGPSYGAELRRLTGLGAATIKLHLRGLERVALVGSWQGDPRGRWRRYWALTPAGWRVLWSRAPKTPATKEVLAKADAAASSIDGPLTSALKGGGTE